MDLARDVLFVGVLLFDLLCVGVVLFLYGRDGLCCLDQISD